MPPHPIAHFEIQTYYQNEPKFNGVYWRNNLPKIKNGAYVINLDGLKSVGTHWRAFYGNGTSSEYFCIGFIDSMLKGECSLDYTHFFSPIEYEKSDQIILKYFQ